MEHRDYALKVIFEAGWKIVVGSDRFGPYSTQDQALSTARTWAANARRQGHQVTVSVQNSSPPQIARIE